jgi:formylglycine-generating enzyme required for sulfatase activity
MKRIKINLVHAFALLLLVFGIQSCFSYRSSRGELVGLNKSINPFKDFQNAIPKSGKQFTNDLVYLRSNTIFIQEPRSNVISTKNDSTLITYFYDYYFSNNRTAYVDQFLISNHEVSNKEYRDFVDWVRINQSENTTDTLSVPYQYYNTYSFFDRRELKVITSRETVNVYPNTQCWLTEFPQLKQSKQFSNDYFTDVGFNDYPVVGVSWVQAQAYCIWRTDRLNEEILKQENIVITDFSTNKYISENPESEHLLALSLPFRLPWLDEWQSAANGESNYSDFPWGTNKLTDEEGEYLANFGQLRDQNNFMVKDYNEGDDVFNKMTKPVKSFAPIDGIYNVVGNVAEWTQTPVFYINERYDLSPIYSIEHDTSIVDKIVKGGSWADGPVYLSKTTNTGLNKNLNSSRVGFRVAMSLKINGVENF